MLQTRKSKRPTGDWRGNTTRTSMKTRTRPRNNSRKSNKPTMYYATKINVKCTTRWAPILNGTKMLVAAGVVTDKLVKCRLNSI